MKRCWLVAALVLAPGCLGERAYTCERDEQCLAAAEGVCEDTQWCAYPNAECPSGRAYGPHAPSDVAGTCVDPDAADTGDGASADDNLDGDGESGTGAQSPPLCGNGVVDIQETCDDGNRLPGDGCHPQCVESGSTVWTATYDGSFHGQDRGFGLALDANASAIYVTGYTTREVTGVDIVIQRWDLERGELQWSRAIDGGALDVDMGEHIAVDSQGDVVVAGVITTAAGEDAWVAKYDAKGTEVWTQIYDLGMDDKGAGVAIGDGDRIIVVGRTDHDARTEAWMQWYTPDGAPDGDAVRRPGDAPSEAIDVAALGAGFRVTGLVELEEKDAVWTAMFDGSGALQWEHLLDAGDTGNAPRGVGQAFDPSGGSATAGVIYNDVLLQRYAADGTVTQNLVEVGPDGTHDEAADVAFAADGSFVLVGFLDFSTTGFARGDTWVRRYDASGEPMWTDRYDGGAQEIDKALGVVLTDDLSAVVVGYETVPGQERDIWLRRYAL